MLGLFIGWLLMCCMFEMENFVAVENLSVIYFVILKNMLSFANTFVNAK